MRRKTIFHVLKLLILSGVLVAAPAESPAFRISSAARLVLSDVVVTGTDDQLVANLSANELEVLVDGKPVPLAFFRLVSVEPATAVEKEVPAAPPPPQAPRQAEFAAPSASRCIMVVLDLGSISADSMQSLKQGVADFLRGGLLPSDRLMLVTIGRTIEVRQEFTGDPEKIVAALDQINPQAFGQDSQASLARLIDRLESVVGMSPEGADTALLIDTGKSYITGLENQVHHVATCLGALTRSLASLPGRKQLVLYSGGYPLDADILVPEVIKDVYPRIDPRDVSSGIWSAHRERLTNYFHTIVDQANRSQVSFYTIDVRGLIAQGGAGGATVRSSVSLLRRGRYSNYLRSDIAAPQDFLSVVAADTGGTSYINTNDMQRVVRRALQDARAYYLVGFQPPSGGKAGQYHKLEVRVRRTGSKVSARQGYYELDDAEVVRRDFMNALRFPELYRQFPFAASESAAGGKLTVRTEIPVGDLEFTENAGKQLCALEIYGALTGKDGRLLNDRWLFAKTYTLEFTPAELADFRQGNAATGSFSAAVPPGEYQLTVIARQVLTGRISTVTRPVVVAKSKK
jgi:VWFA-related protein